MVQAGAIGASFQASAKQGFCFSPSHLTAVRDLEVKGRHVLVRVGRRGRGGSTPPTVPRRTSYHVAD